MNFNLSKGAKKQQGKGKSLGFGLNKRKKPANVFDDGDDSEDEEEATGRDAVNREIAAEQAALRKRAMKAMSDNAYDFDGSYDAQKEKEAKEREASKPPEEKKSRYIQDMLKQSEKRAIERESIYERKVAREQAEEDGQEDYLGKEKFVTKAYKRKLEERQKMAVEEEKQRKIDEQEDVTKRTGGAAMANFYGNFSKNVAMGGNEEDDKKKAEAAKKNDDEAKSQKDKLASELGFMDGFEKAGGGGDSSAGAEAEEDEARTSKTADSSADKKAPEKEKEIDPVAKNIAMRKAREEKLAKARVRYFERNGMTVSATS